jgi:hypothetical protein
VLENREFVERTGNALLGVTSNNEIKGGIEKTGMLFSIRSKRQVIFFFRILQMLSIL